VKSTVTQETGRSEIAIASSWRCLETIRARASSVARIFLLSGVSKLYAPASASSFVASMLPITANAAQIIVIPLSLAEVTAGCLLLLKRWLTTVPLFSSLFFLSAFTIGLFFLGEDKPCGCFGDLFLSQTDEWFVLRSVAFLFLSLFVLRSNVPHSMTRAVR
jgi:hypothetical protein